MSMYDGKAGDILSVGVWPLPGSVKPAQVLINAQIRWIILCIEDGKALLLAEECVDWELFGDYGNITDREQTSPWEKSYIREYLQDFYLNAFSENEKRFICRRASGGGDRAEEEDYVFLLSEEEVRTLVPKSILRAKCYLLDEAQGKPLFTKIPMPWWTRTPGNNWVGSDVVLGTLIDKDGTVFYLETDCDEVGVRPAMWVDLSVVKLRLS